MKTLSLLFGLLFCGLSLFAQEEKEPSKRFQERLQQTDPNKKSTSTSFIGFGFVLGPNDFTGADVMLGPSSDFIWGGRNLFKMGNTQWLSLGISNYYRFQDYRLEQNETKVFPSSTLFDKEKISTHALGLDFFVRLRFDRRFERRQGIDVDLGIFGEWYFATRHKVKVKPSDEEMEQWPFARTSVTLHKGPDYLRRWHYGGVLRMNIRNLTFYGKYRLSNLFKSDFEFGELAFDNDLPKITAGILLDL